MKRFLLTCMVALGLGANAQITVGSGNTTTNVVPWSANFGYSYHQMIYPQTSITIGGTISSLTFTSAGTIPTTSTGATPNTPQAANSNFKVYIGHTTKAAFGSATDWEPLSNLTLVYDGTLTMPTTSGQQLTIPLTTPFVYNNTDNLVVAIHEYSPGYANYNWLGNTGQTNMNLYLRSDTANPDPISPASGTRASTTAKVVLGGLVATTPPSCSVVTAPANAATDISITPTISWSQSPLATSYEIAIGTTPGSANIMPLTDVGNVLTYTVPAANALAYNTSYYVTVYPKNIIGSATACNPSTFKTLVIPCPSVTAPSSSATGVSLTPAFTWSSVTGATGYKLSIGTTAGGTDILNNYDAGNVLNYTYNQTPALNYNIKYYYTVNSYSATSSSTGCSERNFTTKTLCPTVTAPASGATGVSVTPTFTWSTNTDATGYRISIGTTTGGTDILNNVDVGNVLTYTLSTALNYGIKYYYTINAYNATATSAGCSERSFTTLTLCPTVSAPASNAVGVSLTPTFTWAAVNNVTGYRISIGTTSGGTDVLNSFDVGNVLTYTLPTPLNNSTQYYYTIVGYIGTQASSGCSERTFATICSSTNVPYTLDFENVTTPSLPLCTSALNAGSGNTWKTATAPTGLGFNTGKVLNYSYNTSNAANTWFFTQGINLTAGVSYRIKYKYANSAGTSQYLEKLKVAYGNAATVAGMTNVLATYETTTGAPALPTGTTINSANPTDGFYTLGNATTGFVDFTPASTGVYYFGFQAYSIKNMNQIYVDDINIDVTPTCFEPTNVTVASITTSGANVSWTAPSLVPNNGYEVYYSTSNVAPNASTVLNSSNSAVSSSTSAPLAGLASATNYYVWVRSVCGANDKSLWSTSATFKTLCGTFNAPFTENFNSGSLANCWSTYSTNNTSYALWQFGSSAQDYGTTYSATGQNNTAGQFAYVDASDPYTGVHDVTLVSPSVNLAGLSSPTLEFRWFKNHGSSANPTTQPAYDNNKLTVEVKDVATSTWEAVFTSTSNAATWRTQTIALPASYVGKTIQVRFIVDKDVAGNGYFYDNVLLDDISLKEGSNLATGEIKIDKNNIKAYPNPFADVLSISDISNVKSISVVDISGKLVKTFDKPESTLHLRELNSGMYLVILNMKDGSKQAIKAIKK
ncbi:fibronectin type III domain-containing protein [Chryseobacterium sp. CBo1]|uniref:fibronectin type III domain-containing protein n=1 Tax=Chryseobacterium sp. CBo1 TaxID=1869230 RepID=UPI0009F307C7|nr:T9SS type A sorting domain-containing protein [Chryseobacterium sp. CBo1]